MAIGPLNASNDTALGSPVFRVWSNLAPAPQDGDTVRYNAATQTWLSTPFPVPDASSLVRAGYGAIQQSVAVALPNITATAQKLPANAAVVATPINVTQDLTNDGLIVLLAGVWSISLNLAMRITPANTGREFIVRAFNATDAVVLDTTVVGIGRDIEVVNYSVSFLGPVLNLNKLVVAQILSTTDTITGVTLLNYSLNATHVSYN